MRRRARRFVPGLSEILESRLLMANGIGAFGEQIANIAQDGSDYVANRSFNGIDRDGFQDLHFTIVNVPLNKTIRAATITAPSEIWTTGGTNFHFQAYMTRSGTTCDLYVESLFTGIKSYAVTLEYTDNTSSHSATDDIYGTGPNVQFQRAISPGWPAVQVTDLGYGLSSEDLTGPTTSVGADGRLDYRVAINGVIKGYNQVPAGDWPYGNYVVLRNSAGTALWASQPNFYAFAKPYGSWDAQLIPGNEVGSTDQYVLFFQPPAASTPSSLGNLYLDVYYTNGMDETAGPFQLGATNLAPAVSQPNAYTLTNYPGLSATWQGQTASATAGAPAGSVQVALSGLPAGKSIASMVMSNTSGTTWVYNSPVQNVSPVSLPLYYSGTSVFFAPNRNDDSSSKLSLRINFSDGTSSYVTFNGGGVDLAAYDPAAPLPANPLVVTPADAPNLQTILNNNRYVKLGAGVYPLTSQLTLNHAIDVIADPGAILSFTTGGAYWFAAITTRASHIHLDGFTVRVADSFNSGNNFYEPSSLIFTDSPAGVMSVDLRFTNLTLTLPYVTANSNQNTLVGIRTNPRTSGTIDSVIFNGQAGLIKGGPWVISNNDFTGTPDQTDISATFITREDAHDISFLNNKIHQDSPTGITRRFLYIRQGSNLTVSGNNIYGKLGSLVKSATDPIPDQNFPESILTDNINPYYVGKPAFVSADGYLLKVNQLRSKNGDLPLPGHIVSIVDSSYAGSVRWFRIGQVLDKNTYLMLDPLPANLDKTISINYGYYNNTFDHNTWDFSDPRLSPFDIAMSLAGSQFNVKVTNNYVKAGSTLSVGNSFTQAFGPGNGPWSTPALREYRAPDLWARNPSYGVIIEGNVFEDAKPIEVYMNADIRGVPALNGNRTWFEGTIARNTWIYTTAYLTQGGSAPPTTVAVRVGDTYRVDSSDYSLVVDQNDVQIPQGLATQAILTYNNSISGSPTQLTLGTAPAAPGNVVANGNTGATRIDVSWGSVSGAMSYELERSLDGSVGWSRIASLGSSVTSYQDSLVTASKSYYYRVRVKTSSGYSPFSSVVYAIAQTTTSPPPPPTVLATASLNQDGADFVGKSSNSGSNGYQDIHLVLSGLNTGLAVAGVDIQTPGAQWIYSAPFGSNNTSGSWRAEVLRRGLSAIADLYFEPGGAISGSTAFTVTVTYAGGSTQTTTLYGLSVTNASLLMPSLSAVSLNQDGGDLVGPGAASASDGYQDVHLVLGGLNSGSDVASILIQAAGFDSRYYASPGSDNPSGQWRAELIRQGRSTRGDVYLHAGGAIASSQQFTVTVNYANGGTQVTTLNGITVTNSTLPMPAFRALALGQDGRDLVGKTGHTGSNGYQDVHLMLSGLNTALAVTGVSIQAPGAQWEYNAPFDSNNTNGFWRAELLRQGLSSTGDLYFEPGGPISNTQQFTVTVQYADNSTRTFTVGGIDVTNSQLPVTPTLAVAPLNQDGADLVGKSSNSGSNGCQDIHLVLSGLNTGLAVTGVDIQTPGAQWTYSAPFGSNNTSGNWRAELIRQGLASTGDLYFEAGGAISASTAFTVVVTYAGGSTQSASFSGISVTNASLPVSFPSTSLTVASPSQDGADFVGKSSNSGSNGYQDIHLVLSGLNTGLAVTGVDIQTPGAQWTYSAPFGSNNTSGNWRAELIRQGLASTGDLYFEAGGAISASTAFTVVVTYAGGSTQSASFSGISATTASLPMPTLAALSLNQDGSDYVGKSGTSSPSSTQDVHLVLSGLYTGLTITGVDLQAPGFHAEYAAPFGANNTNGNWRAELLRQGMATTADLYFEPGGPITGSTAFTVVVTYAGGVTQSVNFYGISVTNASLPTAQLINNNQDNRDFAGSGNPATPDGYQDVHFSITGIPIGVDISKVVIFGDGSSDLWEYNGLSTSQSIVVDRNVNSSVADLYFQPNRKDRGLRKYYVKFVLSDGTLLQFVVDAIVANPQLAKV